jgi:hypothetical protein
MGMAASQARLLCITARIHDVEYQAQSIQNAKTQLANLSDRAYQDYVEELDATTLTLRTINDAGEKSLITANFNTLCSKNRVTSADGKEYAIRDKNGRLLVEPEIAESYKNFKKDSEINTKDAYNFAMYMIGRCDFNSYQPADSENGQGEDAVHYAEKFVTAEAIKNGNIAPHGLPFTTHTELLDVDTFEYGLSIVDELDLIRGKKTISAKMTDVPGHTKGLVTLLHKKGIKLLIK